MEATINRRQASFRLSADLVKKVLMEVICRKPNKITLEAIKEAKSDKDLETLDLSNFKDYVASL